MTIAEHRAGLSVDDFVKLPVWTRICLAASDLLGWHYRDENGNRFPLPAPSLPPQLVKTGLPEQGIDCSSFTAYCLTSGFPRAAWTPATYADLQIFDAARPWSPIEAVVAARVGSAVVELASAPEGSVLLTQAWSSLSPLSGGHARLCRKHASGVLEVLEASSRTEKGGTLGIGPTRTWTTVIDLQRKYKAGVRGAVLSG